MKKKHEEFEAASAFAREGRDDLLELELQVAHRADELWQNEGQGGASDLAYWLRAEREIFERRFSRTMCWEVSP